MHGSACLEWGELSAAAVEALSRASRRVVPSRPHTPFQSTAHDQTLLAALQTVLSREGRQTDTLAEPVDLSFASERWRKLVKTGRGSQAVTQRRELEVCVLTPSRLSLRAGDLAITGAQSYGDYRQQLLPWADCEGRLPAYCTKVGLPETSGGLIVALKEELTTLAADVDAALPTLNDNVTINERGEPALTRLAACQRRWSKSANHRTEKSSRHRSQCP